MEFEYSSFRNRDGTFFHPSINVTFKYQSRSFAYQDTLVDTGSDFVLLPLSIAEILGAEPDFDMATEMSCACGGKFKTYASRYPVEIIVDHKGFKPNAWQTHVKFVEAEVPALLGHRGFLDHFDATFFGRKHIMKLIPFN